MASTSKTTLLSSDRDLNPTLLSQNQENTSKHLKSGPQVVAGIVDSLEKTEALMTPITEYDDGQEEGAVFEPESDNVSETTMRISLRIPYGSDIDEDTKDNKRSKNLDVNGKKSESDDPCASCPMCVAQREMENRRRHDMNEAQSHSQFKTSVVRRNKVNNAERTDVTRVEAYGVPSFGREERESTTPKVEYRLALKDAKKKPADLATGFGKQSLKNEDNSRSVVPRGATEGEISLQGTEMQPRDRFSFFDQTPIAGFPIPSAKKYRIPEFRPSPIYSRKWVVEKSISPPPPETKSDRSISQTYLRVRLKITQLV